ncbi:hypothetical protein MSKOL_0331 [Methanosarcina sp. Kolksee]|nr:hypothetical protein MSKOL_0331 [Methanosarcina sp. Kolksee]
MGSFLALTAPYQTCPNPNSGGKTERSLSHVILSGYYNHGKHGKHGRNTPLLLISVSSVLSVVFKKFISDILWNR